MSPNGNRNAEQIKAKKLHKVAPVDIERRKRAKDTRHYQLCSICQGKGCWCCEGTGYEQK